MTGLVALALALPLLGSIVAVVGRGRLRAVTALAAGATALAWAAVVAAGVPPEIGRIVVDPVLAAGLAGMALLVAAHPPPSALGACASLSAVTLFAATAGAGGDGVPDRPLAAGIVVVVLLAVLRLRTAGTSGGDGPAGVRTLVLLVVGGVVVAAGAATADPGRAALAVVVGAGVVVVGALRAGTPGSLALPALLVAVARIVPAALDAGADPDPPAFAAASTAAAAAFVISVISVRRRSAPAPSRHHPAVAAVAGSLVLLASELPDARPAGLLLAAASVMLLAAPEGLALVALLPTAVVVAPAFAAAAGPAHAASAAALVVLACAVTIRPSLPLSPQVGQASLAERWPVLVAVTFGLVPLWGWTGADLADAVRATSTAAAFAAPVLVVAAALVLRDQGRGPTRAAEPSLPAPGPVPVVARRRRVLTASSAGSAGTLRARRATTAPSDGRTQKDLTHRPAQGIDPVEDPPPA